MLDPCASHDNGPEATGAGQRVSADHLFANLGIPIVLAASASLFLLRRGYEDYGPLAVLVDSPWVWWTGFLVYPLAAYEMMLDVDDNGVIAIAFATCFVIFYAVALYSLSTVRSVGRRVPITLFLASLLLNIPSWIMSGLMSL